MVRLADELAAPFEPVTDAEAVALLTERYGLDGATVRRLDTERDDTFAVESAQGRWVFKVSHPGDDPLLVNLQSSAMAHAGEFEPTLPLQRMLATLDGELEAPLESAGGERIMRVLEWLPGERLSDVPQSPALLHEVGAVQGTLVRALEDFRHPAADRELAWDLARLPELAELLALAPDLTPEFEAFARLDLSGLPRQVVHNDLNHHNVVVDGGRLGILDFGDTVATVRVADLGVSASYLVDPAIGWASIAPLVAGFESESPLTDAERGVLSAFVRARLVQRILLGSWLEQQTGAPAGGLDRSRAQLAALADPHEF